MTDTTGAAPVRLAFPTDGPAGLGAAVSPHFGHCQYFTIVELEQGRPVRTAVLDNPPHADCGDPVRLLLELGVQALAVRGIGMQPLEACRRSGLPVYLCQGRLVGDQLERFNAGELQPASELDSCGGGNCV